MYDPNPITAYESWKKSFLMEVTQHKTAEATWTKLCHAGLEQGALRLLADYADIGPDVPNRRVIGREAVWSRLDCAVRAERVADKRAKDARADMFITRRDASRTAALDAPWLADDVGARTIHETLRRDGLPEDLRVIRKALKKAAGVRGPMVNPKYFLFLLQSYAQKHGVRLGLKRLTRLADCARPHSKELDEGTLADYFRDIPRKDAILEDTLPLLPPPTSCR